jgi:hypothetical protein
MEVAEADRRSIGSDRAAMEQADDVGLVPQSPFNHVSAITSVVGADLARPPRD